MSTSIKKSAPATAAKGAAKANHNTMSYEQQRAARTAAVNKLVNGKPPIVLTFPVDATKCGPGHKTAKMKSSTTPPEGNNPFAPGGYKHRQVGSGSSGKTLDSKNKTDSSPESGVVLSAGASSKKSDNKSSDKSAASGNKPPVSGNKSYAPYNNKTSNNQRTAPADPIPTPKPAHLMNQAEKRTLFDGPTSQNCVVRALPCFEFPAEPIKPLRNPNAPSDNDMKQLAVAVKSVPKALLLSYFKLAQRVMTKPRNHWNVLSQSAVDVNWLVQWAIKDATADAPQEIDIQQLTTAEIFSLWQAAMTMGCKPAADSILIQFRRFLAAMTLEETLDAWKLATKHDMKLAQKDTTDRLHKFAWGATSDTTRRVLLTVPEVELVYAAAPDAHFTNVALEKLAWPLLRKDAKREPTFLAMSPKLQEAFLPVLDECRLKAEARRAQDESAAAAAVVFDEAAYNDQKPSPPQPRGSVFPRPDQKVTRIGRAPAWS